MKGEQKKIVNAVKTHGADYNSNHEAYAVLLEEVEEAEKVLGYAPCQGLPLASAG